MQVNILGVAAVDFTTKDGKHIKGNSIYVTFPDESVTGEKAERLFLKENIKLPSGVKIGDAVEVTFDMRGRPEAIYAIKA